jgi:predicted nuclease of predicted toxin-antitoxin system
MRIYLDDNSADPLLRAMLAKDGHQVVLPSDIGLSGVGDPRHLAYAIGQRMVILTSDRADFRDLHELVLISGGSHAGILFVAYENNPKRDMKPKHVAAAVQKLERAALNTTDQIVVLNQWR